MKTTIVLAALVALTFTTGFTCSKETPAPEVQEQPAPTDAAPQEEMGAPAAEEAPAEAAPTEAAPAEAPAGQ